MTDRQESQEARQALHESSSRAVQTDIVVENARRELERIRQHRETNHYREKFQAILRGTA